MNELTLFGWGVFGSFAVELVSIHQAYSRAPYRLPSRYQNKWFWISRCLMAVVAGGLVIAYGTAQPMLAIHIGAATPLIIQSLTHSVPVPVEPLHYTPANIQKPRPSEKTPETASIAEDDSRQEEQGQATSDEP